MKIASAIKTAGIALAAVLLAACGGGGGSGNDSGFNPPGLTITASSASPTVQAGRFVDVTVRVLQANGAPVNDGAAVTGVVSPAGVGTISGLGANGPTGTATSTTVGGVATFRFTGTTVGSATLTFSVPDPNAGGRSISTSTTVGVTPGVERVTIEATTTTIPVNSFNIDPFIGSPYIAEVTVTVRTASGQLVNEPDGLAVSINPVGNTGGFSTLDDPATANVNEFVVRLGQGPVNITAGKATIFVHSFNISGEATLTVTAQDPETLEVVSASQLFTFVSASPPLPAEVFVNPPNRPQYITSSGGPTSGQFEVLVLDAIGQIVPNPTSGSNAWNNVQLELVGDTLGARLSGVNASGATVSGTTVNLRTVSGSAGAVIVSGNSPGNVRIRATSDRADNNVDNGISDPVFGERTVAISDGILFDLDITRPTSNNTFVNPETTPGSVPTVPDGTYTTVVSIIATDRLGNPVLPGTTISFGLIDEPQQFGVGDFFLAGSDGNPQEGGTNFTAPGGAFLTAGGGAGPGDALALFGENVVGNRDHESARRILSVQSQTSLTVQRRFNHNDTTGSIVNSGPVLPYVIGRAADGNIIASAFTNELGVATTILNYPVSKIGKTVIIWAQGDGDIVAGQPETVGDVEFVAFTGIAPAILTAEPATIRGNTTVPVDVCVFDAAGAPIGGVFVNFTFTTTDTGTVLINGVEDPGVAPIPTAFGTGCVTLQVQTTGVLGSGTITFSGAGASDTVEVETGTQILVATPSLFFGNGGGTTTLTLSDANGNPVSGIQLFGSCTATPATATLSTAPVGTGVTNASGQAQFTIAATGLNSCGGTPGSGTCTYTTVLGAPSATVTIQGVDELGFSPPCIP